MERDTKAREREREQDLQRHWRYCCDHFRRPFCRWPSRRSRKRVQCHGQSSPRIVLDRSVGQWQIVARPPVREFDTGSRRLLPRPGLLPGRVINRFIRPFLCICYSNVPDGVRGCGGRNRRTLSFRKWYYFVKHRKKDRTYVNRVNLEHQNVVDRWKKDVYRHCQMHYLNSGTFLSPRSSSVFNALQNDLSEEA